MYDNEDLISCYDKIQGIDFHEGIEINNIKIRAYHAGHVLGAAMFYIEFNGYKILYTGDYSMEKDLYIQPAEIPKEKIDVLIVEGTYGVKIHETREDREKILI